MRLLLSVLVICLSYHGTSASAGCIISRGALENFILSSTDSAQEELEDYLMGLPLLTVPGHFIEISILHVAVTKMNLTLAPTSSLRVFICISIHLDCVMLSLSRVTLIVDVCTTLRLRSSILGLRIDDCIGVFGQIRLDALSISIEVPRAPLIAVLSGPICQAHLDMSQRLNFLLQVDLSLLSWPTGCQYDPVRPRITALSIELPFVKACVGVSKPEPPPLTCGLSYPGVLDDNIVFYISTEDLIGLLTALLNMKVFDREMTLDGMTTTTILENFPQVTSPEGLPVVVRIMCSELRAEVSTIGAFLHFIFRVTIGYFPQGGGYVPLIHFVLTGTVGIQDTISCLRRLVMLTVTVLSEFTIEGSCEAHSCVIDNAVAERVFPLRTWCTDILSVSLKERIYVFLPINFSCEACSAAVYHEGCSYISCKPLIVW